MQWSEKGNVGITVEYACRFQMKRGRRKMLKGKARVLPPKPKARPSKAPQVPPVSKLLALAHYYQKLLDEGAVRDYAEIAALTGVTRSRLTQIMNLTVLAPEIQQALLYFPLTARKQTERAVRKIAECMLWQEQMKLWKS